MYLIQWFGSEHREEAHEKEPKCLGHFLRNRAQNKKRRRGGAVQQRSKQGWRFAADAARITDENASSDDRKHTSEEFL